MTVNPGFGGQKFIDTTLAKMRRVRQMIDATKPGIELEVDGGIDAARRRGGGGGANVLVAGTSVLRARRRSRRR